MKRLNTFLIGMSLITLVGCTDNAVNTDGGSDGTRSSSSSQEMEETKNVLYRGRLQEAGVSIFMQGTHTLLLDDGRSILLESDVVTLDRYVGNNVEVFGSVRPTVEAGGMIMRVESVRSLDGESSSSVSSDASSISSMSSQEASSSSASSAIAPTTTVSSISSAVRVSSSSVPSSAATSSATPSSTVSSWEASPELSAKAEQMARDKMGMEFWTQKYCSTHIGFCFPVHKNWWFKSFGATSSALWHVEIGPTEMNNIGEGPLSVRLVSGDVTASGLSDGEVRTQNGTVTGVRAWTGGRHIEMRAPASLEAAVRIITEQLAAAGS